MDLLEDAPTMKRCAEYKMEPVSVAEAHKLAEEIGAVGYISYSALTQQNLKLIFDTCLAIVVKSGRRGSGKQGGGTCVIN